MQKIPDLPASTVFWSFFKLGRDMFFIFSFVFCKPMKLMISLVLCLGDDTIKSLFYCMNKTKQYHQKISNRRSTGKVPLALFFLKNSTIQIVVKLQAMRFSPDELPKWDFAYFTCSSRNLEVSLFECSEKFFRIHWKAPAKRPSFRHVAGFALRLYPKRYPSFAGVRNFS